MEHQPHFGRLGVAYAAVLVIGGTYWLAEIARSGMAFEHLADLPLGLTASWRSASVAGLALLVLLRTAGVTRVCLGGSLALIAAADILLSTKGLMSGGTVYVLAHIVAITGYVLLRDHRAGTPVRLIALAVPILAVLGVAAAVTAASMHPVHLLYPAISGSMAAWALTSRFNRLTIGLGATLFVVSDVLLFWDFAFYEGTRALGWLIWPAYFGGLALIAAGAIEGPRKAQPKMAIDRG